MSTKSNSKTKSIASQIPIEKLREFRHKVAIAKRKGLISKNNDARRAQPTRYMTNKIKALENIGLFEQRASAVNVSKLPADELTKLTELGYQVHNKKIVIPHAAGEKVTVKKGHINVSQNTKSGQKIRRIYLPVHYKNIDQWLHDVGELGTYGLEKNQWIGFKIYDNNSYRVFSDWEKFANFIAHYESLSKSRKAKEHDEFYHHLVLYAIEDNYKWDFVEDRPSPEERAKQRRRERSPYSRERERQQKRHYYNQLPPTAKKIYRNQQASAAKLRREALKNNPAAYQAYLIAERNRKKKT